MLTLPGDDCLAQRYANSRLSACIGTCCSKSWCCRSSSASSPGDPAPRPPFVAASV